MTVNFSEATTIGVLSLQVALLAFATANIFSKHRFTKRGDRMELKLNKSGLGIHSLNNFETGTMYKIVLQTKIF